MTISRRANEIIGAAWLCAATWGAASCGDESCARGRCSGADGGVSIGSTLGGTGNGPSGADASASQGGSVGSDGSGGDDDDVRFDIGGVPSNDAGGPAPPIIPATCDEAQAGVSTVGCLFYAVDMDSHDGVEGSQFAVAVGNVQLDAPATVSIELRQNGAWTTVAGPEVVPALGLHTFPLPDRHADDTQLFASGSYRVVSDTPIIAYQFNPVDGSVSYISDASMLFPVPSLDTLNQVTAWTSMVDNSGGFQHSYATIIATGDGTTVTVTPSVATAAGGSVPAGAPGAPFMVAMQDGDVLNVAVASLGTSMTGTRIQSNDEHPIAVFAGQECALIPASVCCCDHLEEQLAGLRQWGTEFVASRMPVRNAAAPEATLWQIYASEAGTTVQIEASPALTGIPANSFVINAGEVREFYVSGPPGDEGDFHVTADKPINVLGYMIGSENLPPPYSATGDPAAVQLSPVQQFLPRYVVLVPGTWINDIAVITRAAGATLDIDGVPVADAAFAPIGTSGYEVGRIPIPDGVHVLDGHDTPFGVIIVGYDDWDSYAYLGGTGTGKINPNPAG
ncbi:MAG: IgGFc-binding protein [Deltaproteobacteria bacterium]|nr:IgGFc-binding protein [Deltaproteobacteria bacterium]MBK8235581.1 IgGFc-binding protein [Deltaproteobacteria bacterium]MBK8713212.1 IgGFc-binding protein [Deltaproteobacteria bacterium]MBP7286790.1 IgGFc-binding protein [Nannocystaceae bacterium]